MTPRPCIACGAPARYIVADARNPSEVLAAYCAGHAPVEVAPRRPDSLARQLVRSQME